MTKQRHYRHPPAAAGGGLLPALPAAEQRSSDVTASPWQAATPATLPATPSAAYNILHPSGDSAAKRTSCHLLLPLYLIRCAAHSRTARRRRRASTAHWYAALRRTAPATSALSSLCPLLTPLALPRTTTSHATACGFTARPPILNDNILSRVCVASHRRAILT